MLIDKMKSTTYIDDNSTACDLECAPRPRLVYRCFIDKGPGFSESLAFHYGPDVSGSKLVLWMSGDWSPPESRQRYAVAWTSNKKPCSKPWIELLRAYWEAERDENYWVEPNFSEIVVTPRSAMNPEQIMELAGAVWPEWNT